MWNELKRYLHGITTAVIRGEEGQGLVEYSLILALVSIACILALGALAIGINGVLAEVTGAL
jgi:Flp pilus assembly pilin Flp